MKKMLFETNLKGHRMEYIHHIYMGMLNHQENEYVIAVPEGFEEKKKLYNWQKADNIRIVYINDCEVRNYRDDDGGLLKESYHNSKLLRKYVLEERVESVFLISFMGYLPFLPFLLPKGVGVCGILYKIYLYRWKQSSFIARVRDVLKFAIIRFSGCIQTVFVLNDAPSARIFNHLYHTDKFRYITDPFNNIHYTSKNLRKELNIQDQCKVFFHFGGLNRRKGTLVILEAIKTMSEKERKNTTFIFAGKVYPPIRQEFYTLVNELSSLCSIIVYDQFVSNELIADLCMTCDFILAPYGVTIQSSGLLGYAANYAKPVIGPSQGLVGKLIRRHKLGIGLDSVNSSVLAKTMVDAIPYKLDTIYATEITIERFVNTIFDVF